MSMIIKATSPDEFLALVPQLLGCRPRNSLVLVPFHGSRTVGAMRLDLPAADETAELDRLASTFIGLVCKIDDADAVAVVTYTDEPVTDATAMPHQALIEALTRKIHACGIRLHEALCVGLDGWGSYLDPRGTGGGRPLAELPSSSTDAAGLPPVDGDQASGAELPRVDLAATERTSRALVEIEDAMRLLFGSAASDDDEPPAEPRPPRVNPQALVAACTLGDIPTFFEEALWWDADAIAPFDAAALVWCLARPALRDVAISQWTKGFDAGDEALDAQLRWKNGEEYPHDLAEHMWGAGERPDADRLRAALTVSRQIAALAPRASRPGPLAACGWLAWALGRSTHAAVYARQAREIEPEHGLTNIVLALVDAGRVPEWAFHRRSHVG